MMLVTSFAIFLDYSLQLPSISKGIFDDHLAHLFILCGIITTFSRLIREVDVTVANNPAAMLSKLDDLAF